MCAWHTPRDVVGKIKDTASSAMESLTGGKQQDKPPGRLMREEQQRGKAPLYRPEGVWRCGLALSALMLTLTAAIAAKHATTRPVCCCLCADDRQLPQFPSPGGLFGGLVGGLVNQAVKGLASEMQKTAAQTRSVSETAALRIQQSSRLQQRLGRVTVGPAMSQSMSSSNINGRVSKNISLVMPVYGPGGRPVAQAQVTQVEAGGRVDSCVISVSGGLCAGTVHGALWGRGWVLHSSRVPRRTDQARAHVKEQHEDSLRSTGSGDCLHKLRWHTSYRSSLQHAESSQL